MIVIKRVLNNNAVVAEDEYGQTLVALGSGIAFQRKAGQIIPNKKIEKSFYPQSEDANKSITETLSRVIHNILNCLIRLFQKRLLAQ